MFFTLYNKNGLQIINTFDLNELNNFMEFNGIDYIISKIKIIDNDIMIYFTNDYILVIQNYENEYCHEFLKNS